MNEQDKELQAKNVLITGGSGFLGSEITRQLADYSANVTVFDNFSSGHVEYIQNYPNIKIVEGDIRDPESIRKVMRDKEFVIHAAALPFIPDSYYHPYDFFDVNTNGTISIVLAAIKSKTVKKLVYISSSEVYGTAKYVPMNEDHPTLPHSTYAVSKLAAERAVYTMHKEHSFPVVIIRPFNTFGPNITQSYIIPEITSQFLRNNHIIKLGNIESSRDFTFVSDTANGIIRALISSLHSGEVINIGSSRAVKIKDLVHIIGGILGKNSKIEIDTERLRPYDVDSLICDNSKALKLLGWEPRISLEEGLQQTISWVQKEGLRLKAPFKAWPSYYRERI